MRVQVLALLSTAIMATTSFAESLPTYHVPTPDNPELAPYATLPLARVELRMRQDRGVTLKYRIPAELDGENGQHLNLEGVLDPSGETALLRGEDTIPDCDPVPHNNQYCTVFSSASCSVDEANNVSCRVAYDGLTVDAVAAESFLRSQARDETSIVVLKAVGEVLNHQAIGIVFVPAELVED